MNLRQLTEKHSGLVAAMRNLNDHPAGDDGDLTPEQADQFHNLSLDLKKVEAQLKRAALVADLERREAGIFMRTSIGRPAWAKSWPPSLESQLIAAWNGKFPRTWPGVWESSPRACFSLWRPAT